MPALGLIGARGLSSAAPGGPRSGRPCEGARAPSKARLLRTGPAGPHQPRQLAVPHLRGLLAECPVGAQHCSPLQAKKYMWEHGEGALLKASGQGYSPGVSAECPWGSGPGGNETVSTQTLTPAGGGSEGCVHSCARGGRPGSPCAHRKAHDWRLVFGAREIEYGSNQLVKPPLQERFVEKIILHESYSPILEANDIALLKITPPVVCGSLLGPAACPSSQQAHPECPSPAG